MRTRFLFLLSSLALASWLALAGQAVGQDKSAASTLKSADSALNPLLIELGKQQALIAENQLKIDEKIALIAEDLRIARIFAGRGGGKGAAK